MSTLKRIVKNASVTFIGNNILKVLTMILVIFIARYLGDVEYGKFTFAISFTGLFFLLIDLGTRILVVRDIASNKKNASKIISNIIILKSISSLLVFFIIIIASNLLNYSKETFTSIIIASLGLLFSSFSITFSSIFQAYERLELSITTKLIRILLRFAFTIPLLIKGTNFLTILIIYSSVQFIDFIISLFICFKKLVNFKFDFDINFIKSLLKRSFPFFLSGIFVTVYFRIDITLMSKLAPETLIGIYYNVSRNAIIGWYSSAYTLFDALTSIASAVSIAILPVCIIYFKKSKVKLIKIYSDSVKYVTILAFPIAIGITLLADKIIFLLFKETYFHAILALRILIWTIIPLSINYMMGAVMIAIHKEKESLIVLFLNAIINILLNLILIPKFSLYGAAMTTFLTEIFYFSGYYYIISKSFYKLNIIKFMIKPLLASLIMGWVIFIFRSYNLFILIGIGCLLYFVLLYLFKAYSDEDLILIKRIIKLK
jgi:O-antigen/teichoic acid export membrane protein